MLLASLPLLPTDIMITEHFEVKTAIGRCQILIYRNRDSLFILE